LSELLLPESIGTHDTVHFVSCKLTWLNLIITITKVIATKRLGHWIQRYWEDRIWNVLILFIIQHIHLLVFLQWFQLDHHQDSVERLPAAGFLGC
jgi:hypothetical protein